MMERLWGDNFFDPKTKKWTKKHTGTDTCQCVSAVEFKLSSTISSCRFRVCRAGKPIQSTNQCC